jgi:hypothetical protein
VYVPLESLVSKWYGESEQNMAKVGPAEFNRPCETSEVLRDKVAAKGTLIYCIVGQQLDQTAAC